MIYLEIKETKMSTPKDKDTPAKQEPDPSSAVVEEKIYNKEMRSKIETSKEDKKEPSKDEKVELDIKKPTKLKDEEPIIEEIPIKGEIESKK